MGHDRAQARLALRSDPSSTPRARRFVEQVVHAWQCETVGDVAELLTSEVVTNAVVHGAGHGADGHIELRVRRTEGTLRVEVVDRGQDVPVVRDATSDDLGGRGMLLVDALSREWGVSRAVDGSASKAVWFELSL